jgi:hypothetical protein
MKNNHDEIDVTELAEESPNKIAHLKKANSDLMSQNKKLREALGDREEMIEQVCGAISAQEPYLKHIYKSTNAKAKHPIIPVLMLSDWHIGEVVKPNEIEGFNRYNWEIAQAGVFGIVEDFLKWVEIQRSFYDIKECTLFVMGDMISGDIHQELMVTNEFPLPVQTAKAGNLLGEVFRIMSSHFDRVNIFEVAADNHSRLQKKPQAKQKTQNSMGYLVHEIANGFAAKCSNLNIVIAEGAKLIAPVNDIRFLVSHGDGLKGTFGIPFYAFQREIGKEAVRRMRTSKGFDIMAIGHFHTPCLIEGRTIVNGSLSGTSEFDSICGRHSKPCQVAFLTHPSHGLFNLTPFVRRDVTKK